MQGPGVLKTEVTLYAEQERVNGRSISGLGHQKLKSLLDPLAKSPSLRQRGCAAVRPAGLASLASKNSGLEEERETQPPFAGMLWLDLRWVCTANSGARRQCTQF